MSIQPDEEYCAACGDVIKKEAALCPNCGTKTDTTINTSTRKTLYCTSCGEKVVAEAELCPSCGVRQTHDSSGLSSEGSNELLYYGQIALGVLFILSAIGTITEPEGSLLSASLTAMLLGLIGLALIPQVRSNIEKEYSVTEFGSKRRTKEVSGVNTAEQCVNCGGEISDGVRRTYMREFVFSGIIVHSSEDGTNRYCATCSNPEQGRVRPETPKQTQPETEH